MKKANTKIFLTILFLFIIILAFLYFNPIVKSENNNNKQCILYKAISTNYTYQNLDNKKHVARFKILQNKDNLYVEFHPNFVITQPGEIKNYWIEAKTNKKINESEITYLIEVNKYPLQTIKTKLYFECEKYQTTQNNNTNNTTNQTNNNNFKEYKKSLLSMLFGSIKKLVITLIIILIILILLLYYIVKIGRQKEIKKTKTTKEQNTKKQKLEKMLEARVKVKKGLTTFQKIIIVLFIILLIILAIIAIKTMSFNSTTFTAPITTNITNLS